MDITEITTWRKVASDLKLAKALESKLRKDIVAWLWGPTMKPGTHKLVVGDFEMKADAKLNYKVDPVRLNEMNAANVLTPAMKAAIVWKPSVSVSNFNKMTDEERLVLAECVTAKPGMPTLSCSDLTIGEGQ